MITIRLEKPDDLAQVRTLNEQAFETPAEATIVDALRENCDDLLSLVAEDDGRIVGHIVFSPTVIEGPASRLDGMGLAPMAVLPERQRQGIGSRLVKRGLDMLRERGCSFVVVLGHPEYYPRFGFVPASWHGLRCQWEGVPDDAFLVMINDAKRMKGVTGVARYRDEFDAAM
jgi:putative acetyltransferase